MSQVKLISECYVQPKSKVQNSAMKPHYLSPIGFKLLSIGNTQHGLLFKTTSSSPQFQLFNNLKLSLSQALEYFYPLAGRLVTQKYENEHICTIFVDCNAGRGARLIHASALDVEVSDVVALSSDLPPIIHSFFDLGSRQVNHDGHTRALLSIQLTDLSDGLFLACCMNHCLGDGTSVSIFLNTLSQIFLAQSSNTPHRISQLDVTKISRLIFDDYSLLKLPYLHPDEFITRFREPQNLRERIFHFSVESMANLKAKANTEANNTETKLSSFKSLCGLVWRSITRARNTQYNEDTTFSLAVNIRARLTPPLPSDYFPPCYKIVAATAKTGELLEKGLGWAAMKIHKEVEKVDSNVAHKALVLPPGECPTVITQGDVQLENNCVMMGGSPWFGLHKVDFGVGKPVAYRKGYTNRRDGKVNAFVGHNGPGSVDLDIALSTKVMEMLLLDEEFMNYTSSACK